MHSPARVGPSSSSFSAPSPTRHRRHQPGLTIAVPPTNTRTSTSASASTVTVGRIDQAHFNRELQQEEERPPLDTSRSGNAPSVYYDMDDSSDRSRNSQDYQYQSRGNTAGGGSGNYSYDGARNNQQQQLQQQPLTPMTLRGLGFVHLQEQEQGIGQSQSNPHMHTTDVMSADSGTARSSWNSSSLTSTTTASGMSSTSTTTARTSTCSSSFPERRNTNIGETQRAEEIEESGGYRSPTMDYLDDTCSNSNSNDDRFVSSTRSSSSPPPPPLPSSSSLSTRALPRSSSSSTTFLSLTEPPQSQLQSHLGSDSRPTSRLSAYTAHSTLSSASYTALEEDSSFSSSAPSRSNVSISGPSLETVPYQPRTADTPRRVDQSEIRGRRDARDNQKLHQDQEEEQDELESRDDYGDGVEGYGFFTSTPTGRLGRYGGGGNGNESRVGNTGAGADVESAAGGVGGLGRTAGMVGGNQPSQNPTVLPLPTSSTSTLTTTPTQPTYPPSNSGNPGIITPSTSSNSTSTTTTTTTTSANTTNNLITAPSTKKGFFSSFLSRSSSFSGRDAPPSSSSHTHVNGNGAQTPRSTSHQSGLANLAMTRNVNNGGSSHVPVSAGGGERVAMANGGSINRASVLPLPHDAVFSTSTSTSAGERYGNGQQQQYTSSTPATQHSSSMMDHDQHDNLSQSQSQRQSNTGTPTPTPTPSRAQRIRSHFTSSANNSPALGSGSSTSTSGRFTGEGGNEQQQSQSQQQRTGSPSVSRSMPSGVFGGGASRSRTLSNTSHHSSSPSTFPAPTLASLGLSLLPLSPNLALGRYGQPLCGAVLDKKYLLIGTTVGLDFLPLNREGNKSLRSSLLERLAGSTTGGLGGGGSEKDGYGSEIRIRKPMSLIKKTRFKQLVVLGERSNVLLAVAGRNDHVRVYALDSLRAIIEKKIREIDDKEGHHPPSSSSSSSSKLRQQHGTLLHPPPVPPVPSSYKGKGRAVSPLLPSIVSASASASGSASRLTSRMGTPVSSAQPSPVVRQGVSQQQQQQHQHQQHQQQDAAEMDKGQISPPPAYAFPDPGYRFGSSSTSSNSASTSTTIPPAMANRTSDSRPTTAGSTSSSNNQNNHNTGRRSSNASGLSTPRNRRISTSGTSGSSPQISPGLTTTTPPRSVRRAKSRETVSSGSINSNGSRRPSYSASQTGYHPNALPHPSTSNSKRGSAAMLTPGSIAALANGGMVSPGLLIGGAGNAGGGGGTGRRRSTVGGGGGGGGYSSERRASTVSLVVDQGGQERQVTEREVEDDYEWIDAPSDFPASDLPMQLPPATEEEEGEEAGTLTPMQEVGRSPVLNDGGAGAGRSRAPPTGQSLTASLSMVGLPEVIPGAAGSARRRTETAGTIIPVTRSATSQNRSEMQPRSLVAQHEAGSSNGSNTTWSAEGQEDGVGEGEQGQRSPKQSRRLSLAEILLESRTAPSSPTVTQTQGSNVSQYSSRGGGGGGHMTRSASAGVLHSYPSSQSLSSGTATTGHRTAARLQARIPTSSTGDLSGLADFLRAGPPSSSSPTSPTIASRPSNLRLRSPSASTQLSSISNATSGGNRTRLVPRSPVIMQEGSDDEREGGRTGGPSLIDIIRQGPPGSGGNPGTENMQVSHSPGRRQRRLSSKSGTTVSSRKDKDKEMMVRDQSSSPEMQYKNQLPSSPAITSFTATADDSLLNATGLVTATVTTDRRKRKREDGDPPCHRSRESSFRLLLEGNRVRRLKTGKI